MSVPGCPRHNGARATLAQHELPSNSPHEDGGMNCRREFLPPTSASSLNQSCARRWVADIATLRLLAKKSCTQLDGKYLDEDQADQVAKNIAFVACAMQAASDSTFEA